MDIYTDASAFCELALGSWAYSVPSIGARNYGIVAGTDVGRFELLAAVVAIEHVVAVDAMRRPIHLHSDSEFALGVLRRAAQSTTSISRGSYLRAHDLFARAATALASRRFEGSRPERHCPDHRHCHDEAYRRLQEYIRGNSQLSQQLEMYRAQHRCSMLLRDQKELKKRLSKVERALAIYRDSGILPPTSKPRKRTDLTLTQSAAPG